MAGYKIQLKDKDGNRQYPVSTTDVVVDADGVSVADLLDRKQPTLVSGVNIKTVNGKTLLGEGDLVIEGGNGDGSASVETRVLYVYLEGAELTEEEKAYNKETYDKIANGENVQLVFDVLGIPITHAFYAGDLLFTCSVVVIEGSALYGQGRLFSDGNYEYEEGVIGSSSGETAESDVICVIWDDDTSDIPSNKEAYQKLAESINTVGKPAAVMVCVETGFRWGIAKYYWKSNVGGDIELTTPVTESGLYCVFTLTSEGVCTASYKQVDLGGGGENALEDRLGVYVSDNLTAEQIEHNKNAYETYYNAADKPAVYIIGASSQPIGVWQSSDSGVEFLAIDALVYFGSSEESILYVQTMARWNADGTITEMQGGLRSVPTAEGIKTINGQSLIGKGDLTIGGSSLKEVVFYIGDSLSAEQKATNVASYNAWMQAEGGHIKSELVFVGGGLNGLVMRPSVVWGKNGNLLASVVMTPMPSSINASGDYPLKTIWYTIHSDGTTNETTNSEL